MSVSPDDWRTWLEETKEVCLDPTMVQVQEWHYYSKPDNSIPMSGKIIAYSPALHKSDDPKDNLHVWDRRFTFHLHQN